MNINLIIGIIAITWLVILTIFVVWLYLNLKGLIVDAKKKDFLKLFKEIQDIQNNNKMDIVNFRKEFSEFKNISKSDISKVGIIKFNPFSETGGDHSFSLTLLDGRKNGIIITSLHTRERTRVYLKEVFDGRSKIDLSNEERKSLNIALKN